MSYQWISVDKELPPAGEEVFVYYGNKFISNGILHADGNWELPANYPYSLLPVSHWCRFLTKNEAISVKNMLPPIDKPVIIYMGERTVYTARLNENGRWTSTDYRTVYIHLPVTHWADYPNPPM